MQVSWLPVTPYHSSWEWLKLALRLRAALLQFVCACPVLALCIPRPVAARAMCSDKLRFGVCAPTLISYQTVYPNPTTPPLLSQCAYTMQ